MAKYLMEIDDAQIEALTEALGQVVGSPFVAGFLSKLASLPKGTAIDLRNLTFVNGAGDVNVAWYSQVVFCMYSRPDGYYHVFDIVNGGHPAKRPSLDDALNWALGRLETHIIPKLKNR